MSIAWSSRIVRTIGALVPIAIFNATLGQTQTGSATGVDPTLLKLLAHVPAFTARAEARVFDSAQKELLTTPMLFSKLGDKIRVEVDFGQIRGRPGLAPDAARMKEFGLDKVISITRPDKRRMYLIYPGRGAYVAVEMPKDEPDVTGKTRAESTELGREILDGHPCVKCRVLITDPNGMRREVFVWKARDLNDFPIQIQTTELVTTVQVRYSDVQLAKPDAKLFDPPAGYTKFDDLQQLIEGKSPKASKPKSAR